MESFSAINKLLSVPNGIVTSLSAIIRNSMEFIQKFEKPSNVVGERTSVEEMRPILSTLKNANCPHEIELIFALILKILLRKESNRNAIGKFGMNCIVQCLSRQLVVGAPAAAELGNVVLNACFDSNNVLLFINEGGLTPLLGLLRSPEVEVQASSLGALQGICYTTTGKYSLRTNTEAIQSILRFLISDELTVRARAVGTIHNISADPLTISLIRDLNGCSGIPMLITLLHDPSSEICHAAAGTLQNLARDAQCRTILSQQIPEGVVRLIDLLFSSDVKCQLAAVGAILNIIGPVILGKDDTNLQNSLQDLKRTEEGACVSGCDGGGGTSDNINETRMPSSSHSHRRSITSNNNDDDDDEEGEEGDDDRDVDDNVYAYDGPKHGNTSSDEEDEDGVVSSGDVQETYNLFKALLSDAIALGAIRSCVFDLQHDEIEQARSTTINKLKEIINNNK